MILIFCFHQRNLFYRLINFVLELVRVVNKIRKHSFLSHFRLKAYLPTCGIHLFTLRATGYTPSLFVGILKQITQWESLVAVIDNLFVFVVEWLCVLLFTRRQHVLILKKLLIPWTCTDFSWLPFYLHKQILQLYTEPRERVATSAQPSFIFVVFSEKNNDCVVTQDKSNDQFLNQRVTWNSCIHPYVHA